MPAWNLWTALLAITLTSRMTPPSVLSAPGCMWCAWPGFCRAPVWPVRAPAHPTGIFNPSAKQQQAIDLSFDLHARAVPRGPDRKKNIILQNPTSSLVCLDPACKSWCRLWIRRALTSLPAHMAWIWTNAGYLSAIIPALLLSRYPCVMGFS